MVPAGPLVAEAIQHSQTGCLINIFAGIPATTFQELDLDTYIARRCFMFGTSGSVIEDMRIVLDRVRDGQLDTNCSVDAVCGMAGAVEALAAVEQRTLAGKIIVYPMLHQVGLIPLSQMTQSFPAVAEKLEHGQWTRAAEEELLRAACKYGRAIVHTAQLARHLDRVKGSGRYELEMSVDETDSPTTPAEHFFVANELTCMGVRFVSLAPRFIGDGLMSREGHDRQMRWRARGNPTLGELEQIAQKIRAHVKDE